MQIVFDNTKRANKTYLLEPRLRKPESLRWNSHNRHVVNTNNKEKL
jgi:hypothetical protein